MNEDKYSMTLNAYNRLAKAYEDKFMDLDLYDDTYDQFCSLIPVTNASILEIGCGPGNISRYLLRKNPGYRIHGIDAAPNMIDLAIKNNPAAEFSVMDCRNVLSINKTFDGIISGFCMPYISKEECQKQIQDCYTLLNKGGVFYMSVIEGDYNKSGFETTSDGKEKFHVYYHEADYLLKFLSEAGFGTPESTRLDFPRADGSVLKNLILISRKK
ncbi:MAG: methyltransferase family protein [Bacteroidetes bacterium]|jgi:cyclopropane fatty-acyl-phospholipid synthase-like methyltransferase|nr:methyltransferase family protein [Bacteroidota bacterium]